MKVQIAKKYIINLIVTILTETVGGKMVLFDQMITLWYPENLLLIY